MITNNSLPREKLIGAKLHISHDILISLKIKANWLQLYSIRNFSSSLAVFASGSTKDNGLTGQSPLYEDIKNIETPIVNEIVEDDIDTPRVKPVNTIDKDKPNYETNEDKPSYIIDEEIPNLSLDSDNILPDIDSIAKKCDFFNNIDSIEQIIDEQAQLSESIHTLKDNIVYYKNKKDVDYTDELYQTRIKIDESTTKLNILFEQEIELMIKIDEYKKSCSDSSDEYKESCSDSSDDDDIPDHLNKSSKENDNEKKEKDNNDNEKKENDNNDNKNDNEKKENDNNDNEKKENDNNDNKNDNSSAPPSLQGDNVNNQENDVSLDTSPNLTATNSNFNNNCNFDSKISLPNLSIKNDIEFDLLKTEAGGLGVTLPQPLACTGRDVPDPRLVGLELGTQPQPQPDRDNKNNEILEKIFIIIYYICNISIEFLMECINIYLMSGF
jgi:hypothetical protein